MKSWSKWDGTGRDRPFLDLDADDILYYRYYTAGKDYRYSEDNQLVKNLKMGPGKPASRLRHRTKAIDTFGHDLRIILKTLKHDAFITCAPPSQAPGDPAYDDRMSRVLDVASKGLPRLSRRDVLYTKCTRPPQHYGVSSRDPPRDPQRLADSMAWHDVDLSAHDGLIIVDDVLTCGTTFRAMSNLIREEYPEMEIVGLFWAITVDPPEDA